jgi:hypothetical protein
MTMRRVFFDDESFEEEEVPTKTYPVSIPSHRYHKQEDHDYWASRGMACPHCKSNSRPLSSRQIALLRRKERSKE